MSDSTTDVLVIGGGAAGLMAAVTAAEQGARTMVLEKNDRPGRKLAITGKGRCNVTNHCDWRVCVEQTVTNPKFLYHALRAFPPERVMAFFEDLGCPLKTERGGRVFPVSDRAADVTDALLARCRELGVEIRRSAADHLTVRDGIVTGAAGISASAVILATGGFTYPRTGSTGDGCRMAAELGHTVVPPTPSLVPLLSDDPICAQGAMDLKNVGLALLDRRGKTVFSGQGEATLTERGLDGPLVLSASAHMGRENGFSVALDLKPALSHETLDARILRDLGKYRNCPMETALTELFPRRLILPLLRRAQIPPDLPANSLTREQRGRLREQTKKLTIPIRGKAPMEEGIVTSGGVAVTEVDPKTMASRLVPGLYFAGEILDVDAYTGGFNLQIAWATGRTAGLAAARAGNGETR